MKKLLLTLMLVMLCLSLGAQEASYELRGFVATSDGTPIPGATLTLKSDSADTQLLGTVSDARGKYRFTLSKAGTYRMEVRFIGYKTLSEEITIAQPKTEKNLTLEENVIELSEVQVVAKHTKLQPNGNIRVRFKGNPVTKGKTMSEVLRFVPGVEVHSNQLVINGKEDNLIYIGDQAITPEQLNAIPPSMVDHIEVIPNPGGTFGKHIKGGILMITLKEQEGLLGSVSLPVQFDELGVVDVGPVLFLQYQKAKVSLYNTLRGGGGRYTTIYERQDRYESDAVPTITTAESEKKEYAVLDNFGLRYQINKQHALGAFGGVTYSCPKKETINRNEQKEPILTQGYRLQSLNLNGGVSYQGRLNVYEGMTIASTLTYSHSRDNSGAYYVMNSDENAQSTNRRHYLSFHPRASLTFAGGHTLAAGIAYAYGSDYNEATGIGNPLLAQLREQRFTLSGFDFSPYVEYSKMLTKQLYLQAGLRYQTAIMHYRDALNQKLDYTVPNRGLYPNLLLQYMINPEKASGIGLAYRHFFSLPNYGYYSPVATYQTANLYSIGNRQLRQETFDEGELNYYLNRDWSFTYRVRYGRHIVRIMTYRDESASDLFYTKPDNVGTQWAHYASAGFSKTLFPFWRTNNTLYFRYDREWMPNESVQSFMVGGSTTHQFTLTKWLGLTVAFSGETAQKRLGYTIGAKYGLDMGCYASLLKDRLELSITVNNLINNDDTLVMRTGNGTELLRIDRSPQTRIVFTASYSFSAGDALKPIKTERAATLNTERPIL